MIFVLGHIHSYPQPNAARGCWLDTFLPNSYIDLKKKSSSSVYLHQFLDIVEDISTYMMTFSFLSLPLLWKTKTWASLWILNFYELGPSTGLNIKTHLKINTASVLQGILSASLNEFDKLSSWSSKSKQANKQQDLEKRSIIRPFGGLMTNFSEILLFGFNRKAVVDPVEMISVVSLWLWASTSSSVLSRPQKML